MDTDFIALAEQIIDRIDDRFGRLAAVLAAFAMVAIPVAALLLAIARFTSGS